jgi:hypothetical protein
MSHRVIEGLGQVMRAPFSCIEIPWQIAIKPADHGLRTGHLRTGD